MKKILLILLLISQQVFATNYYVSGEGNNANTGLSDAQAWATITYVNGRTFAANDSILFERGFTYTGSIIVNRNTLNFGAYGSGALPIISGLTTLTGWTLVSGNVYKVSASAIKYSVNMVLLNGIPQAVGRFPNRSAANGGYLTYTAFSGRTTLTAAALNGTNWSGAEVVSKKEGYILERDSITSQSVSTITYTSLPSINPRNNPTTLAAVPPQAGFGLFIQRDVRTLDSHGEWYFNNTTKDFSMYFSGTPSGYAVQTSIYDTLMNIGTRTGITVSNLQFEGANLAAIYFQDASNITVKNCTIKYSGAKGIFGWNTPNTLIQDNTIEYSMCGAIDVTGRYADNVTIKGNTIKYTAVLPGMSSFYDDADAKAIYISVDSIAIIRLNNVDSTGYAGIQFQGSGMSIDSNYVDHFNIVKSDAGGIYTYSTTKTNRLIKNNIVVNGSTNNDGNAFPIHTEGIYIDGGAMGVTITDNTISNIPNRGIYINDPKNIFVRNNTVYNSMHWSSNKHYTEDYYNFQLTKNIFFKSKYQTSGNNQTYFNSGLNATTIPTASTIQEALQEMGLIDSNYYRFEVSNMNPFSWYYTPTITPVNYTFPSPVTFAAWKTYTGHDLNSISFSSIISDTLVYNATSSVTTCTFTGYRKKDVYGTTYNNSAPVPALGSILLIDDGTITNTPPVANAGADQSITLPTNSTTLTGSGTDADGTITAYSWSKISGPSGTNFITSNTTSIPINNLIEGVYIFQLTVTDNAGGFATDQVTITVNPNPNTPPVVSIRADTTIVLPTSTVSLTGSATDNGTIASYSWAKVSGPSCTISNFTTVSATASGLIQGTYLFSFTATDNLGLSTSKTVTITVSPDLTPVPATSIILYNWKF